MTRMLTCSGALLSSCLLLVSLLVQCAVSLPQSGGRWREDREGRPGRGDREDHGYGVSGDAAGRPGRPGGRPMRPSSLDDQHADHSDGAERDFGRWTPGGFRPWRPVFRPDQVRGGPVCRYFTEGDILVDNSAMCAEFSGKFGMSTSCQPLPYNEQVSVCTEGNGALVATEGSQCQTDDDCHRERTKDYYCASYDDTNNNRCVMRLGDTNTRKLSRACRVEGVGTTLMCLRRNEVVSCDGDVTNSTVTDEEGNKQTLQLTLCGGRGRRPFLGDIALPDFALEGLNGEEEERPTLSQNAQIRNQQYN